MTPLRSTASGGTTSPKSRTGGSTSAEAISQTAVSALLPGLQRTEPLTAEDRADIDMLIAAAERGFRLATRCTACGQWLVAPSSVRRHLGPVCRKRAK